ncbi:MAG: efflux RND transporter periplasmic adaptor subunit [Flavobacteriia bacterium]|nr:efflux RND transporter periplasmic adaptor subunit [Flavobacteriia bacterium]OJX35295.1 MAG: hypothetical protein BGO87_11850 [Flavobacteriia bacterium 40-80]
MKKKGIIAVIIIAVCVVFAVVKLSANKKVIEKGKEVIDRSHIPVAVNVESVKMLELSGAIIRPSIVEPNEKATIAPSMSGKLESLSIQLGSKVGKDQTIGKIDTKTLNVQLKNLQLTADKLKTDLDRNKELFEGKALSETQYLDSKYAYESRLLELEQLKQQLSDSYIKSPVAGTIIDKKYVAGEFVSAGSPVATVVDVDVLKIYVYVNQSEVRFIKMNQEAHISASVFPDKSFKGKVTYIAPSADNNYNYKIEVQVRVKENPELKAGTYVNVKFEMDRKEDVLQVPKKALVEGVKNAYVYVQNGDRAERRTIRVGRENGEYIEVVEGLKENEKVVIDGQINIVDKSLIQAKESK